MQGFIREILTGIINLDVIPTGPPGTTTRFFLNLLTNGLILLFVSIILIAIVYAALAGLKYIRSQGETEKVEEAQNALKSIFIGVASVFVGVIVVALIAGIFTDQSSLQVRESLCVFLEPTTPTAACVAGSN